MQIQALETSAHSQTGKIYEATKFINDGFILNQRNLTEQNFSLKIRIILGPSDKQ